MTPGQGSEARDNCAHSASEISSGTMSGAPVNYCSHCGARVTILSAKFCKACGATLMAAAEKPVVLVQPVIVEATDKKWKIMMVQGQAISKIGLLIWFLSLGMCYHGAGRKSDVEISASMWVWLFSWVTYYVGARITKYAKRQA
jgi:hypothetical protein